MHASFKNLDELSDKGFDNKDGKTRFLEHVENDENDI